MFSDSENERAKEKRARAGDSLRVLRTKEEEAAVDAVVSLKPGFLSVPRAALWLDLSTDEVYKLIQQCEIRPVRRGRRVLIPLEELEALKAGWIDASKKARRA